MLVKVVFKYRTLMGKCELGVGLDWDEIEQVTAIESAFEPTSDDRRMKAGRRFRREPVKLSAILRGDRINDQVDVVEIVITDGDNSYRFGAEGVWLKDDGDEAIAVVAV